MSETEPGIESRYVFVVYADYGTYEGCQAPWAAFDTEAEAALAIYKGCTYSRENMKIIRLELGFTPEKNHREHSPKGTDND